MLREQTSGSHHGHNTSAIELSDGTYAVIVSEVVPFTIYQSKSLDGPWTACPNPTGELIKTNGVNAGSDNHWDSNVNLTPRHDGKFRIVRRHGLIAIADDYESDVRLGGGSDDLVQRRPLSRPIPVLTGPHRV